MQYGSFIFHIEPNTPPMSWREFCRTRPPNSIAADGYVIDGPKLDPWGLRVNCNHHAGCSRLDTRCSAMQILLRIRVGFFGPFLARGDVHVYANDCDEDVCAACFVLANYDRVKNAFNPEVNRLLGVVDLMDTFSGGYPFRIDLPALEELAWIFAPYREIRLNGELDRREEKTYIAVIERVMTRFLAHLRGEGEKLVLDPSYDVLFAGTGWQMIAPRGRDAYVGVAQNGIRAFAACRSRSDGRHAYSFFRAHQLIPLEMPAIFKYLSSLERAISGVDAPWGGGDLCGGSNRVLGSGIAPKVLFGEIEGFVRHAAGCR